jgi:general secretion pathway protein J
MTACLAISEADRGDDAGFTLVEVLVALALFSLLATLLFSNVRLGLSAWAHGRDHAESFEQSLIAQNFLRRMIGDAYPAFLVLEGNHQRVDFDGAEERVSFIANAPSVAASAGRFRFSLFIERKNSQSDLVMTSIPELASQQNQVRTKTLLLADIGSVSIAYFGVSTSDQVPRWYEHWAQRNELPKLVRVRVAFKSDDARSWPDLVIAPRISADVSCVYDPTTTRCRGR